MWWRHRQSLQGRRTDGERLVSESEEFLKGRLVDHVLGGWHEVPVWVWLNTFAHGTREEVAALGDGRRGSTLRYLAEEILAVAEDDADLRTLQSFALIPLELHMLASGDGVRPEAGELASGVIGAICSYRQNTQR